MIRLKCFGNTINRIIRIGFLFLGVFIFVVPIFAQQQNTLPDFQSLSSLFALNRQTQHPQNLTPGDLTTSIDENTYRVDSGDEFYIRVDVQGPDVKIFNPTVSADGMLILPDISALYLRGMILKKAKQRIVAHLKAFYHTQDKDIDVSLSKIHKVRVSIIGALQPVVNLDLTSADRLVNAIQKLVVAYQADTLRAKWLSRVSVRHIDLIRNDERTQYDLLRFLRLSDLEQNPLLQTNDIIYVHFRDSLKSNITVGGQVGNPGIYEFIPGDNLALMTQLAGGLLPAADSSRIEVYRRSDLHQFRRVLSLPSDSTFLLKPGDQIFVRAKIHDRKQKFVQVEGEVRYPGLYPIIEGQTRLSDIVKWCGGFTPQADIKNAFVKRQVKKDKNQLEVDRILFSLQNKELSTADISFFKTYYRQKLQILQADFAEVLNHPGAKGDFLLKENDVVMVPAKTMVITIGGGVKSPGIYPYVKGFTIKDYVQMAGGYSTRVKKSMIKIIKGKSGAWLDAKEKSVPVPGDEIFIPRRNELEFWPVFKEALTLFVQIGTVFVIIRSTR